MKNNWSGEFIDENINAIGGQDYFAFGEIMRNYNNASVNDKYKFTEKERDTETNYDYFGARYYDSEIGRWMQVDPLGEIQQGWTPYHYAYNNPLKFTDPDGRFPWGAIIGAAVELGSQIATDMITKNKSFGEAFDKVDWADVSVAAATGLASGGISSLSKLGNITKTVLQVGLNVAEGAVQANVGKKKESYGIDNAVMDLTIGAVAEGAGILGKKIAQNTNSKTLKTLKKTAKKYDNIAKNGRKRIAQSTRAKNANSAVKNYGSGVASETIKTTATSVVKKVNNENE